MSDLAFMVRALRHRNYRLFFAGQIISLLGTWMTNIATSWLVYRLTGSALLLGAVGFAGQFPAFLMAPIAGIFVDRWDQRRLLLVTQTLSMLESFALAALTLSGRISISWLLGLNVFQAVVNAFDMPCRQSLLVAMIEGKEDLSNAIALNSTMVNSGRLLGPALGALVIAAAGEGWCFLIDGVTFLPILSALLAMRFTVFTRRARAEQSVLGQMREGWDYAAGFMPIRSILALLALVSLVGVPYGVLMPVFAAKVFRGGPATLGLLMGASGCGALSGALWLAARKSVLGLGRAIALATAGFGTALVLFALSSRLWLSLPIIMLAGFSFMIQMASSNTILQMITDDDKRGRVTSFFMMAFMGTAPFGSLLAGSLADHIGAPRTLMLGGFCCVMGAIWFASGLAELRRSVQPIYARMGILAEAATPS